MDNDLRTWPAALGVGVVLLMAAAFLITATGTWESSAMSGWIQAFGSIAAILATGSLASSAISANRKQEADRYARRMDAVLALFQETCSEADFLGSALRQGADVFQNHSSLYGTDDLRQLLVRLDAVQLESLESRLVAKLILDLRSTANDVLRAASRAETWSREDWEVHADSDLQLHLDHALDQLEKLQALIEGAIRDVQTEMLK